MPRILAAFAFAWLPVLLPGPALATPAVGMAAPALSVPELGGDRFDLAALRGRVVIINFWATWCLPCRQEMPALDSFYAQFHSRGLDLVGISVDRPRDRAAVVRAALAVHYPVALLADAVEDGFGRPAVLPVTFVVDQAGKVRAVMTPDTIPVTEDALEHIVAPLLVGASSVRAEAATK
jgi:cytochrome c biogenesis protein CcmG/thiol:disulfide interchange protein DsbE